jgi:HEAT repeat protein
LREDNWRKCKPHRHLFSWRQIMQAQRLILVAALLLGGYLSTSPVQSDEPAKEKPKLPDPKKVDKPAVVKADPDVATRDEQLLQKAKVGLFIAKYLTKRSGNDADLLKLEKLVQQLASKNVKEREDASKRIVALGMAAMPALRALGDDGDEEVVSRAKACQEKIVREADWGVSLAAVRTMLRREQPKTIETLLRFLPYAGAEPTVEAIWFGLDQLTEREGKVDPLLLGALKDTVPARRALAACIIGHRGTAEQRAAVRKLLTDKEAMVRLRAAQGLLAAKDKTVIPVLVELLQEPSVEVSWQAEELLHWIAGEEAPQAIIGAGKPNERKECQQAWAAWWTAQGPKLDLAKLEKDPRRPILLFLADVATTVPENESARVWLCGCDGKPRWQLSKVKVPCAVQWVGGNQVFLAEGSGENEHEAHLTERDLDGKIVWGTKWKEQLVVLTCRRLPDGNTFLAASESIVELGRDGKPIYEHRGVKFPLVDEAYKLDDNQTVRIASAGDSIVEVDARSGTEISKSKAPLPPQWRGQLRTRLRLSPDGQMFRLLIEEGKVVQMSTSGKIVWERAVKGVRRIAGSLLGGNLLLSCYPSPPSARVVEMDQTGRVVWEAFPEGALYVVQPCFGLIRVGFTSPRPSGVIVDSVAYRLQGLKSKKLATRQRSAAALKEFEAKAEEAIPLLIEFLADPDALIREYASDALVSIGKGSIPPLLKALKDKKPLTRLWAISSLCRIKAHADAIVPPLINAMKDEDIDVRMASVLAFEFIGPEGKAAVPALIKFLDDRTKDNHEKATFSEAAMKALCAIGPDAKPAIPKLLALLQDKDERLWGRAVQALGAVAHGDEAVVKKLVTVLKTGKTSDTRWAAVATLGGMGPAAKVAVPALVEALKFPPEKDPQAVRNLQEEIAKALEKLGAEAKEAVPALILLLKDKTKAQELRIQVARTLGAIGPEARAAIPVLAELAVGKYSELRDVARRALENIILKEK